MKTDIKTILSGILLSVFLYFAIDYLLKENSEKKFVKILNPVIKNDYLFKLKDKYKLTSVKYLLSEKSEESYKKVALALYNARGIFNDNEDNVYTIFRLTPSLADFSVINYYLMKEKGIDLITFVTSFMNKKELRKLDLILKDKPDYKK